ncbi:monocarboxylate transporter 9 isoform X1 [Leptinotarsa decemlineata]|uniref:monocarboxylate transporter 9 isoform X1 n=2 Tax=Leptinotarsa decemlineata TaxID=7539 RepID=UPI003D30740C
MEKENGNSENDVEEDKVEFTPLDGGYGWVVVFAIVIINATLLPLVQCFGIIFDAEFSDMGVTAAQESFLLHLHSSMYCVVGFFSSPLLKMYNFSYVALFGASLWCFGIFLSSFAKSYATLLFTVSILIGVGQGIALPATYLAQYSYFKKKLTLAVSISTTGASILAIFMPKICDILLLHQGRRNAVLVLFAISLLSLVGCVLMKPPTPEKRRRHFTHEQKNTEVALIISPEKTAAANDKLITSNVYQETTIPNEKEKSILTKLYDVFDFELLKQLPYVVIVIGLGVSFAAELNGILTMQFMLPELSNFTRTDVANVASIQSIFDISARLLVPLLTYRLEVPPRLVYVMALILATVARLVIAFFSKSYVAIYFGCSLIGLTKGTRAVFQSVIIPQVVPIEKIPAANGINFLFNGAVSLAVGPIIGTIHDVTHSYIPALHAASEISLVCVVLWALEFIYSRRKSRRS